MATDTKGERAQEILEVFRDLGLEDEKARERFKRLGNFTPWADDAGSKELTLETKSHTIDLQAEHDAKLE